MTEDEAYRILGIPRGSGRADIEQAYRDECSKLQRQMVPGRSLPLRRRAAQQLAQLASARELLQKQRPTGSGYPPGSGQRPMPAPAGNGPRPLPRGRQGWPSFTALAPLPRPALITSFLIAASVMCVIMLLCFNVSAEPKEDVHTQSAYAATPQQDHPNSSVSRPIAPSLQQNSTPARLRVLSVPWCHVEIDGRSVGPSGQAEAFELQAGAHQLRLRCENRVLSHRLVLEPAQRVKVWVQFEKGKIHVTTK